MLEGDPGDWLFSLSVSGLQGDVCRLLLGFKVHVEVRSLVEALCVVGVALLLSLIVPYKDTGLELLAEVDSVVGQEVLRCSSGAVPSLLSLLVPARLALGLDCGLALGGGALLALEGRVRSLSHGEEGWLE